MPLFIRNHYTYQRYIFTKWSLFFLIQYFRDDIKKYEGEVEILQKELHSIQEQSEECQATYDSLAQKDKYLDRTFKNHFADLSPIIVDQCYKFFK